MKRHPVDVFSLIAGLFVTTIAVAALTGPWRLGIGPWVWPSLLVGTGVVIIGLVLAGRGEDAPAPTTADEPDPERAAALAEAEAELGEDPTRAPGT